MFKYSVNLIWSKEDNCYVATIAEFPGLSALADTPEEAVEEVKIAAESFMQVYKEDGDPIPEPIILNHYSGQTRVRLPKSLHKNLAKEAELEGVSLNTHIVKLLSERSALFKVRKELENIKNNIKTPMSPIDEQKSNVASEFGQASIVVESHLLGNWTTKSHKLIN